MTYFVNFVKSVFPFLVYSATAYQNVTTTNLIQSDAPSSSLTGAYRPAEIVMSYNTSTKSQHCPSQSFAKYMVSIRKLENPDNFGHTHFCGGVIIRSNLIITAAHCLIRNKNVYNPSSIRVVARTPARLRRTTNTQIIKVKKIIIYETFSGTGFVDMALLKLQKHITLDEKCAAVINLPKQRINDSTICTVLGWGKLYLNGPMANEILQLNVTLHSKEFCQLFMSNNNESKICASDMMDNEKNPCSGDSGGPLICEGILTGIVSYGFQCGYGFPTIYTDVYEYSNWIQENNAKTLKLLHIIILPIILVWVIGA